jgi:hypothetical protein
MRDPVRPHVAGTCPHITGRDYRRAGAMRGPECAAGLGSLSVNRNENQSHPGGRAGTRNDPVGGGSHLRYFTS